MPKALKAFPVIDLFAGPGGLGEGFASFAGADGEPRFESVVAIEHDEPSYQTLLLRHFLRQFPHQEFPHTYYKYLRREIVKEELYDLHPTEFAKAQHSALKISLGPENHALVQKIIGKKLSNSSRWVLVGGPPCQAYSLVGRSKMMGRTDFEQDERHFLYREYLKIIVDHQPPVFVMENVKGLLSAKIGGEPIINRIVGDLASPKKAVGNSANGLGYKLYSLSEDEMPGEEVDPRLFLVRAEDYGVPQARHRMFIVGIRKDLNIRPGRLSPHSPPTLRQTIGGLPALRSSLSKGGDCVELWRSELTKLSSSEIGRQLNGSVFTHDVIRRIERQKMEFIDSPTINSSSEYCKSAECPHGAWCRLITPSGGSRSCRRCYCGRDKKG